MPKPPSLATLCETRRLCVHVGSQMRRGDYDDDVGLPGIHSGDPAFPISIQPPTSHLIQTPTLKRAYSVCRCIDAGALTSLIALPLSVSVWLQASGMLAFQFVLACQGLTTYEAFNGAAAAGGGGGGGGGGEGLEGSFGRLGLIVRNFKAVLFPRSSPLAVHFGDHAPRKQAKSD
jgi:hypothetical protein